MKYKKLKFIKKENFYKLLLKLEGEKFQIDESTCSVLEENLIKNNFSFLEKFYHFSKIGQSAIKDLQTCTNGEASEVLNQMSLL